VSIFRGNDFLLIGLDLRSRIVDLADAPYGDKPVVGRYALTLPVELPRALRLF
jgi:hypothetical protein